MTHALESMDAEKDCALSDGTGGRPFRLQYIRQWKTLAS
jgi:hypothetical protein